MSEGFYTGLRSNRSSSWKRLRADDLDSEGWSRRSNCLWEGCRRPGRLENGKGDYRPFCSSAHRDYHNADLFDMFKHGGAHVIKQPSGRCKLSGCGRSVWVIDPFTGEAYDFCTRQHSLTYKENMAEQWQIEERLCKLNDCDNHRAVEETSRKIHEYCCRDHLYSAAGARGKLAANRKIAAGNAGIEVCSLSPDPRIVEAAKTDGGEGPSRRDELLHKPQEAPQQELQAQIDNQQGYHEKVSMEAIENCLTHLLANPWDFKGADPIGLFRRVPNVTDFHPWDEVIEFDGLRPRYYVHYIDSAPGKQRRTKERFHWKQSGGDNNKSKDKKVITHHFFYELMEMVYDGYSEAQLAFFNFEKDKRTGELQKGGKNRWRLYEFSLSGVVIGEKSPEKVPVISKISQEKRGLPVWPPIPQKRESRAKEVSNENYKPVSGRIISQAISHIERERGMTSSNSSNISPPSEGLALGDEILQGASSYSQSNNFPFSQNISMKLIGNESNGSSGNSWNTSMETLEKEIFQVGTSGNSWNTSVEALGKEILQVGASGNSWNTSMEDLGKEMFQVGASGNSWNTSMETLGKERFQVGASGNSLNILMEILGKEIFQVGASDNSWNTSTRGGGLPFGGELLQEANANDTKEFDIFDDILEDIQGLQMQAM